VTGSSDLAGLKLGNYRLGRVLGKGNMGVVYLATDEALLRPTAVKVLTWSATEHDPEAWFLAEARSVARLNHPAVIQIYSVARHGPHRYIAMEYVDGVSADVKVTRDGVFSAERATEIMLQLAGALELAHASGLIHRDIKPGNILLKRDGDAKLGDFGMAVSAGRDARAQVRAGTPHYLAPEIWRNQPARVATDLYAFGATYYYLVTGRPPLDGATLAELGLAHQRQEVAEPVELARRGGAACLRVIRRCLAKQPEERYGSARELAWELRGVLRELESTGPSLAPGVGAGAPDAAPSSLGEPGPWQDRGFWLEPFAELDPREPPYAGPPFDDLLGELDRRFASAGTTLVLTGETGSGRSVLARSLLTAAGRPGVYIDLDHAGPRRGGLVQRVARAFGAIAGSSDRELEGLLEALARMPPAHQAPLVVVDSIAAGTAEASDVAVLARMARSTRYFSLLVVGPPGVADLDNVLAVPPLAPHHVGRYIAEWLRATRPPGAPPLIFTLDASLLVGLRADGNLDRINALVRQLIATGQPVLTSWDAWAAPDDTGRPGPGLTASPVRPAQWPTPEVLQLINQCRATAGLVARCAPCAPA